MSKHGDLLDFNIITCAYLWGAPWWTSNDLNLDRVHPWLEWVLVKGVNLVLIPLGNGLLPAVIASHKGLTRPLHETLG